MNLFINLEKISFLLEDEKNVYQLVVSIEKQLTASASCITSIAVNNKKISFDKNTLKNISLDVVESLHIDACLKEELNVAQIQTTIDYIQILIDVVTNIEKNNREIADTVLLYNANIHLEDIKRIAENIDYLFFGYIPSHFPMKDMFLHACANVGILEDEKNEIHILHNSQAIKTLEKLASSLTQRISCILHPQEYGKKINEIMIFQLPEIQKIPELFSTGEEKLAIHYFVFSIDLISMWMQSLADTKNFSNESINKSWQKKHKEFSHALQEFLVELSAAFEVKDWVTVNDLLEYEIIPKIKEHTQNAQINFSKT